MAAAPIGIVPVLTPHTLGVLADTCEQDHLPEEALSLRLLAPFIEEVIEKYFMPLVSHENGDSFASRFKKLSHDFGPLRIYLNSQIFNIFAGKGDVGSVYEQVLLETLDPLMRVAREMNMGPELIAAAVRDYIKLFRFLWQTRETAFFSSQEVTISRFEIWFDAATRFDYVLTAVFLILERSMPAPTFDDRSDLLLACKEALLDLWQATSKMVVHEPFQQFLYELETPRVEIKPVRDGIRSVTMPEAENQAAPQSSNRQLEMSWLARHKDLVECYRGQWIVLEGDQLIANDVDYLRARKTATQKGIEHPFIFFVPGIESGAFMGI